MKIFNKNIKPTKSSLEILKMHRLPQISMGSAGSGFEAAQRIESMNADFNPSIGSADSDLEKGKDRIDNQTIFHSQNDPIISSSVTLIKDKLVGSDYVLDSEPAYEILEKYIDKTLDETWASEFKLEVEQLFSLIGSSRENWLDAQRKETFTGLVRLGVASHIIHGEIAANPLYLQKEYRPLATCFQMIDPARINYPYQLETSENKVRQGVKKNRYGQPVGYYILNKHPRDSQYSGGLNLVGLNQDTTYIPARKPNGRKNFIHIHEQRRIAQTRGVTELVSALKEIKLTSQFRTLTLQKAAADAMIVATLESDMPSSAIYESMGVGGKRTAADAINSYVSGYYNSTSDFYTKNPLKVDGSKVPVLPPGTRLNFNASSNGLPSNMVFEQSLIRSIAANLGVSYEELARDFSQVNYSSAQAAFKQTQNHLMAVKSLIVDAFATNIFDLVLGEWVMMGKLTTLNSRFSELYYTDPLFKDAISKCYWIGASQGNLDPLKETQAAVMRINNNLSSHDIEIPKIHGKRWEKIFESREKQNKILREKGLLPERNDAMNSLTAETKEIKGETNGATNDESDQ